MPRNLAARLVFLRLCQSARCARILTAQLLRLLHLLVEECVTSLPFLIIVLGASFQRQLPSFARQQNSFMSTR